MLWLKGLIVFLQYAVDLVLQLVTGRIMRLETLHVPVETDSQECFWKEEPSPNKSFTFFLRFFIVSRPDLKPEKAPELGKFRLR